MSEMIRKTAHAILLFTMFIVITSSATTRLPALFSDNMVLQQKTAIPVWGWTEPNEKICVQLGKDVKTAVADSQGNWKVAFDPMDAGGPYTIVVKGSDTITITNVMIGEVWLCSGQSNMEWKVRGAANAEKEIESANWPSIRMFSVGRHVAQNPQTECEGAWKTCTPENVGGFSAVGYFFGRHLHQSLNNVPIGLITSSWGGTPIEAWMDKKTLQADNDFLPILVRYQKALEEYPEKIKEYNAIMEKMKPLFAQHKELSVTKKLPDTQTDPGNEGEKQGWANKNYNDSTWEEMAVPGQWEKEVGLYIDGAVWFRKVIDIPSSWAGKPLILSLGAIDDFDVTYWNGIQVGSIGKETPNFWEFPRKYTIDGKYVKSGKTVIAIRVFDHFAGGGFNGTTEQMNIKPVSGNGDSISLAGKWNYKVEVALNPAALSIVTGTPKKPMGPGHAHSPSGLFNGMIHPLAPYAIKGAIWYQGESNAGRAYQYRKLLPALIADWRTLWKKDALPFGIVQLANFMQVQKKPSQSSWAELREAQALTCKTVPNTGLAVAIDVGEADDIHPKNKQDVGKRLGLWALSQVYNQGNTVYSGPMYNSLKIKKDTVFIGFEHTGKGLVVGSDTLQGFSIAGKDSNFVWAEAKIINDSLVAVTSQKVQHPVAVRYGWADNPTATLYNSAGLPAVPFRTDTWPGVTHTKK